jgi:ABC-2 type transport system ATP-binding protein
MADAIVISGLRKTFGTKVAVQGLDLRVPEGSLCGFIGPNGAGKTTTIRMIMSIIFPDAGELSVLGRPSAVESKDRIGYLPEERGLYKKMKVGAFLTYMAKLKGVDAGAARRKASEWLGKVGLGLESRKRCEELSKGMQQKVQFIAAVIHEPDLLILDEVFSGLDPVNRRLMRGLIDEQHRAGRTIVFSTHAMYEAEQLCDRIFMIHRGVKVLDDTLGGIRAKFDPRTVVADPIGSVRASIDRVLESRVDPRSPTPFTDEEIEELQLGDDPGLKAPADEVMDGARREPDLNRALAALTSIPGVESVRIAPEGLIIRARNGVAGESLIAPIASTLPVRRVELQRVSLEDVFIDLVERSGDTTVRREDLRAPGGAGEAAGAKPEVARV